jgi:phosphatidylcholine synthase
VVSPSANFSLVFILITAILTFTPIMFIHPGRVKILRPLNLAAFIMWGVSGLIAVYFNLDNPILLDALFIACSVYLFVIGFILQLMGKLR